MVEIRALTEADIDAVAEVTVRAWRSAYAGIIPPGVLAALDPAEFAAGRRSRPPGPGESTRVATEDGQVIGFARYGPLRVKPGEIDLARGELYAIYIDPDHHGAGTGRALITAAKDGLKRAGYADMLLWVFEENHHARGFYQHMGLAADGERHFYTPVGSTVELPEVRYATRL
jgi:GNAT superfamily N-acetyltransferase